MITNLLVVYACLVAVLALADRKLGLWQRGLLKMLTASLFLYLPIITLSTLNTFELFFFVGLIGSWLGDLCLVWSGTGKRFKVGIFSFLLAHVAYGTAFLFAEIAIGLAALLLVSFCTIGVLVYMRLSSNIEGALKLPVQIYILALCAMTAFAWSVEAPYSATAFGLCATAFLVSDISVALQRFGTDSHTHRIWGIPLYFGAQMSFSILITKGFS